MCGVPVPFISLLMFSNVGVCVKFDNKIFKTLLFCLIVDLFIVDPLILVRRLN